MDVTYTYERLQDPLSVGERACYTRAQMTGSPSSCRVVRFGVFEANFSAQELCKHGTRVHLRGQSFALLEMLVERNGEIVTRE